MDEKTYQKTVEDARKVIALDRQVQKKLGRKAYLADYISEKRASARDVGHHPHTAKLEEKKLYQFDLEKFLKEVFPEKFWRPFSEDQIKFIQQVQKIILEGGQYAVAMPRAEGKSTIITCSVIWSILYGHRRFVVVVCADRKPADRVMKSIKKTFDSEKLSELFPELTHYVKALAGMSQRAAGQVADGKSTHIGWNATQINLPFVPMDESFLELCKGSVIVSSGITCGIRGLLETLPDGTPLRPDFLFLDDPQTRESANSPSQCRDRATLIKSDLLPMSGIGTEIACLMACTVIEGGDLADKTLSEWQSTRAKALYTLPAEHNGLWKEYIDLYREAQKQGTQQKVCNDFYAANRVKMDKGAVIANPYRINTGELSALQSVYNFISKYGEASFWSELQNEPKDSVSSIFSIKPPLICSRLNHMPRYQVPAEANFLVVFGDINFIGINYLVMAFTNNFTGYVIDYGKYPEGRKQYLIDESQEETATGAQLLSKGILDFVAMIYKKHYTKNGKRILPNRMLIDGNFMTETVLNTIKALQRSRYPVLADRGRSNKKYRPAKQDKIIGQAGNNYFVQKGTYGEEIVHNADYWRMISQKAFLLAAGVPGSCSIWGNNPKEHEEFSYEVCSEKLVKYDSTQNFYEWNRQPNQANDKLDALVGCYVAAAFCGAAITGGERSWRTKTKPRRETRKAKIHVEEY